MLCHMSQLHENTLTGFTLQGALRLLCRQIFKDTCQKLKKWSENLLIKLTINKGPWTLYTGFYKHASTF